MQYAGRRAWDDVRLGAFTRPDLLRWEGHTLGEVIAERGEDPVDVLCDLLLEEDLRVNQVTPGPWTETLRDFIRHPVGMVGTDSTFVGEKPSPRTYGSFPRILGQFVREEALVSLEEAVRSMTSAAAARLGLSDRGLVRDGYAADLVVFDPARVRSNATYDQPRQFPTGIEWVVVGGEIVVEAGEHTGARPGRVLRRATEPGAGFADGAYLPDRRRRAHRAAGRDRRRSLPRLVPRRARRNRLPRIRRHVGGHAVPGRVAPPRDRWRTHDRQADGQLRPPADPDTVSHELTMRVPDCMAAYDILRKRGAEFLTPPVTQGREIRAFFRDPDGHLLEISEVR